MSKTMQLAAWTGIKKYDAYLKKRAGGERPTPKLTCETNIGRTNISINGDEK